MGLLNGITANSTTNKCRVKVSSTDPVCGYLGTKLVAGTNITLTETASTTYGTRIQIDASPGTFTDTYQVKVTASGTAGYLCDKITTTTATSNITLTKTADAIDIQWAGTAKISHLSDVVSTMTPADKDILTYNGAASMWTSDDYAVTNTAFSAGSGSSAATVPTSYVVKKYVDDLSWEEDTAGGRMYKTQAKTIEEVGLAIVENSANATLSAVTTNQIRDNSQYLYWYTASSSGVGGSKSSVQRYPHAVIVAGDTSAASVSAHASIQFRFNIDEDVDTGESAILEIYGPVGVTENAQCSIFRCDAVSVGLGESYTTTAGTTCIDGTDSTGTGFLKQTANSTLVTRCQFYITGTNLAGKDTLWVSLANYSTANKTQTCVDSLVHCATLSYTMFQKARLLYRSKNPRLRTADYS